MAADICGTAKLVDTQACCGKAAPSVPLSEDAKYMMERLDNELSATCDRVARLVQARHDLRNNPHGAELLAKYRYLI